MFLFVCLFLLFDSEIFHRHVDVIIMVKSCKVWPIIESHDHWAVRTHSDTGHPITWSSSRTMTPVAERLALKMSLLLWTTGLSRPWIESDFPRARRTVYRPMRSISKVTLYKIKHILYFIIVHLRAIAFKKCCIQKKKKLNTISCFQTWNKSWSLYKFKVRLT